MITQKIFGSYKIWFENYISGFVTKYPDMSENIEIKAEHSRRVWKEIRGIAQNLKLNEEDFLLAETIGLFHDIGRFKQYVKYQTFSDSKSQNHSELGVEVLKEQNILSDLAIETQEIIYKSIINHSRAEVITDKNGKVEFFSKLIRDADKLDIWRLITEYYMVREKKGNKTLELDLPDNEEISDQVYNAIVNNTIVLKESMKTLNDFKLLQIAWVFDLNFKYSIKRLYDKKYLNIIFDSLPQNQKVNEIKQIVDEYFSNHIETLTYN